MNRDGCGITKINKKEPRDIEIKIRGEKANETEYAALI